MKQFIATLLLITLFTAGCKKEEIQPGDNLVLNGSFEDNGNFNTDGWIENNTASETDVPGGGGNFSLKISPASSPAEGNAEYEITDITGTKTFQLTTYIKAFGDWPGNVSLRKVTNSGVMTILGLQATSENEWVQMTIDATTTMATGDKLIVHLSAGSTESPTPDKYALFDLVVLKEE